jgi:hypothetical protein
MGADMASWVRNNSKKEQAKAAAEAKEKKYLAERGENLARIQRLEAHAQQASAYAQQQAAVQQQRAAAESAARRAAEEAARKAAAQAAAKAAEQTAVNRRSQKFDAQRAERKASNPWQQEQPQSSAWQQAQATVQSSFGSGGDASQNSKYNVMGKDYNFSSSNSESSPNGNVEATGDNKPPSSQTFANDYKSKVLEDQKAKKANDTNNFNANV